MRSGRKWNRKIDPKSGKSIEQLCDFTSELIHMLGEAYGAYNQTYMPFTIFLKSFTL